MTTKLIAVEKLQGLVDEWFSRRRLDDSYSQHMREKTYETCADELQSALSQAVEVDDAMVDRAVDAYELLMGDQPCATSFIAMEAAIRVALGIGHE